MTTFDEREAGFEAKFTHDADVEFRVNSRRNKLLGHWAAAKLGMTGDAVDTYAKAVIASDFEEPGEEDVFRKVLGDLVAGNVAATDLDVRAAMGDCLIEARRQIMGAA